MYSKRFHNLLFRDYRLAYFSSSRAAEVDLGVQLHRDLPNKLQLANSALSLHSYWMVAGSLMPIGSLAILGRQAIYRVRNVVHT